MRSAFLVAAFAVVVMLAYPANGALLLHYTFDETDSDTALDTGAAPAADGTYNGSSSRVTPGVGGSGGAFSTGDGASSNYLTTGSDVPKLDGLSQFTITGFVKVSTVARYDRLVSKHDSSAGFDLFLDNPSSGSLSLSNLRFVLAINGNDAAFSSNTRLSTDNDEYVFFAVTYDSNPPDDQQHVAFYWGSETEAVSLINTSASARGTPLNNSADLRVGGTARSSSDRTPAALFDDIRIYNEILDLEALEAVRLSAVPEPATAALALAGIGLMGLRRRRG